MVPSSSSGLIYPLLRISLSHVALLVTVVWCVLIPGLLDMTQSYKTTVDIPCSGSKQKQEHGQRVFRSKGRDIHLTSSYQECLLRWWFRHIVIQKWSDSSIGVILGLCVTRGVWRCLANEKVSTWTYGKLLYRVISLTKVQRVYVHRALEENNCIYVVLGGFLTQQPWDKS